MGDMGSLCPSYDFSFSTLLLIILLLRETDTLSIAVPKRMVNCWLGFGLSSCNTRKENRASYYYGHRKATRLLRDLHTVMFSQRTLKRLMLFSFIRHKSSCHSGIFQYNLLVYDTVLPGSDSCFAPLCWLFGAGCYLTVVVGFWHC